MFKTVEYLNNRKVAEAVSRFLSTPVDPLFYLSSFQNQMGTPSAGNGGGGFHSLPEKPMGFSGKLLQSAARKCHRQETMAFTLAA